MADLNAIFSNDTLKAADLKGKDAILTIKEVEIVTFEDQNKRKSQKPLLHFHETDKTFISNKTNSMMIGEHYGYDTDNWPGQKITIYPTRTDFGNTIVDCIRIRPPVAGSQEPTKGLPGPAQTEETVTGHLDQGETLTVDDEIPF